MAILNSKQRIVDTLLTQIGRENLSNGSLGVKYVAFTDKNAMYIKESSKERSSDFIEFGFESQNSNNDFIFFTSNDLGRNIKYNNFDYLVTEDGFVYDAIDSYDQRTQRYRATIITGSNVLNGFSSTQEEAPSGFSSIAGLLSTASFKKIKNKMFLSHKQDPDFLNFSLDKNKITFSISDNFPIKKDDVKEIELNSAEPLFFDQYVSNIDTFKFMPPVFPKNYENGKTVGNYLDLNQKNIETFGDVKEILKDKPQREINIDKTSFDSNLIMQVFETTDSAGKFIKLDTIDFGEFNDEGVFKKVIFAGKTFIDDFNYPTYVNLFTIIMEE